MLIVLIRKRVKNKTFDKIFTFHISDFVSKSVKSLVKIFPYLKKAF